MIQIFVYTSYLTAMLSLVLGVYVFSRNYRSSLNRVFALLCASAVIWSFGLSMVVSASTLFWGVFWAKVLHVGVVFLHTSFFHFVVILLEMSAQQKLALRLFYASSFVFLLLIPTNLFVLGATPVLSFNYYTDFGVLYPLFLGFFFSGVGYGCWLMMRGYSNLVGHRRKQVQYFLVAAIIGFLGGSTTYLPALGISIFPIANYFVFLYTIITAYAITRYQLLEIKVVIKKGLIYSILTASLTGCFISIVYVGTYLIDRNSIWVGVIAAFVVALLFQPLRDRIQGIIDKLFFKSLYDYRETLCHLSQTTSSIIELDSLLGVVRQNLAQILKTDSSSFFLLDKAKNSYFLRKDGESKQNKENNLC